LNEKIWSHLKSLLRTVHGVFRTEMESFVAEFAFKRIFLKENSPLQITRLFEKLIDVLFD
jgi:hypothetical protein